MKTAVWEILHLTTPTLRAWRVRLKITFVLSVSAPSVQASRIVVAIVIRAVSVRRIREVRIPHMTFFCHLIVSTYNLD
jgi:hypothetical protein